MVSGLETSSMDITVELQADGSYAVYGRDAAALYEKMRQIPAEARDVDMGELKDGMFTFTLLYDVPEMQKKIKILEASARGYNAPTTIAIAG